MKRRVNAFFRWAYDVGLEAWFLLTMFSHRLSKDNESLVVSMTSYPARIDGSWVSLESIFRQRFKNFKLVLTLAESQFPGKKLPLKIRLLVRKGLSILWVKEDNRSWDHLWPAYSLYRGASVITVDDDKVFPPTLVGDLVRASEQNPGAIIGSRGWEMKLVGKNLGFKTGWVRATSSTESDALFMPPGNGSLYPPGSLADIAGDTDLMKKLCPRADDVWYWAAARLNGTASFCLGLPAHRPVRAQSSTPALADEDPGTAEFGSVIAHFDLLDDISSHLL